MVEQERIDYKKIIYKHTIFFSKYFSEVDHFAHFLNTSVVKFCISAKYTLKHSGHF